MRDDNSPFWKWLTVTVIIVFVIVIVWGGIASEKEDQQTPCSNYSQTSVQQLPARCLNYYK